VFCLGSADARPSRWVREERLAETIREIFPPSTRSDRQLESRGSLTKDGELYSSSDT